MSVTREQIPGPVKPNGSVVGVSISTYHSNTPMLDIREYYKNEDGTFGPTPRGCRFANDPKLATELILAVAKVSGLAVKVTNK